MNAHDLRTALKFSTPQVTSIVDSVVPLIASEEDQGFFRGVLLAKADSCNSSAEFVSFVEKLLKTTKGD